MATETMDGYPAVSQADILRRFVIEKLGKATQEIVEALVGTVSGFEQEVAGLRQELDRQKVQLGTLLQLKQEPPDYQFPVCQQAAGGGGDLSEPFLELKQQNEAPACPGVQHGEELISYSRAPVEDEEFEVEDAEMDFITEAEEEETPSPSTPSVHPGSGNATSLQSYESQDHIQLWMKILEDPKADVSNPMSRLPGSAAPGPVSSATAIPKLKRARSASPASGSAASCAPDSDSVCSSDEDWVPAQEGSEDEYCGVLRDNEEDEDGNPVEREEERWRSKDKKIEWLSSPEPTLQYVPTVMSPVPGPTRYAKKHVTDQLTSSLDLFLTEDIIRHILRMTNQEGQRAERNWREVTEMELRGFLGLLLLGGVYRSKGESTRSLWEESVGRPVFRATMSRNRFDLLAMKIQFDDKLTRDQQHPDNKLAAIWPIWEPWVKRFAFIFNPGKDVCVDEQQVSYNGRCSFKQYMPQKTDRYGIKVWTLVDVSTSYVWKMDIYSRDEKPLRETDHGESVVLTMTEGLKGRSVTTDKVFTSYDLGEELLRRKNTMIGMMRKSKPELPPQLVNVPAREELSSIFAHTDTHTAVSYMPKKGRSVVLMSTKHRDATVSPEAHQKPTIMLDFSRGKSSMENLEKEVATFSCRRRASRWSLALFYHLLDVTAFNAFVLWTFMHPKWEITKKYRRRLFLEQLGMQLVTPCVLKREKIPRGLSAAAFVQAAHEAAPLEQPHSEDEEDFGGSAEALTPRGGRRLPRRPCELCPKSPKRCKVRNVCVRCGRYLCKKHTLRGCMSCLTAGQPPLED